MCAIVFYRKQIGGKVYPRAARTGPYAFAQEVSRVNGRVVTRYLGIMQVPDAQAAMQREEDSNDDTSSEESLQQKLQ